MIIVRVMGGLGNQMQQYALCQKLKKLGREAKLDVSWFEKSSQKGLLAPRKLELLRFAGLPMDVCTRREAEHFTGNGSVWSKIRRRAFGNPSVFTESQMYHPEIFDMDERYLEGYFACTRYYDDILPELKELFRFPEAGDGEVRKRNADVLAELGDAAEFRAAMHLRRGDYLDEANREILGGICTPAYYAGAVRILEECAQREHKPLHLYVFSDDPDYVRCQLEAAGSGDTAPERKMFGTRGEKVTLCDFNHGEDNLLDMQLMAACRGIITANSTFSFWGGRLNLSPDAVKIRPLYHRNNQVPDPAILHGLWRGWTLVDRNGQKV